MGRMKSVAIEEEAREASDTSRIDAFLEEAKGGYTVAQLQEAFDSVKDADHWKNPIDAIVDADRRDVLARAIPWYTGTTAEFHDLPDDPARLRVTAPGYYEGPCN